MKSLIKLSFILLGLFVFQDVCNANTNPITITILNETRDSIFYSGNNQPTSCTSQFPARGTSVRQQSRFTSSNCRAPFRITVFMRPDRRATCTIETFNGNRSFKIVEPMRGVIRCDNK